MDDQEYFPRILIVGASFDTLTGGGITMSNLFKGWPKDRLAVISDLKYYPNTEICSRYYRYGAAEYHYVWPLSYFFKHRRISGEINVAVEADKPEFSSKLNNNWQVNTGHTPNRTPIWKMLYAINDFVGYEHIIRQLKLSPDLAEWTKRFHPDLIYTQAGCLHEINLVDQLIKILQVPYVIHIMDDWPSTLYADKLLAPFLRWQLNRKFQNLLLHSSAFMGISTKMSEVYQQRYRRPCLAFHNPLEVNTWINFMKRDWTANTPFHIMYRGRIGTAILKSLVDICNAVFELFQEGRAIQFDITLTPSCDAQTKRRLERPGCVSVQATIPYKDIPTSLASADLLVLSYDFDPDSIKFIRYSMPTKATEYMISGTPVLVYGGKELAVIEYAQKEQWGYVVSKPDVCLLKQAIIRLMDDQALRERLGRRAQELAILNHNAIRVRNAFRQNLNFAVKNRLPFTIHDV